ncbi:hypothetical protein TB1_042949 [Malus domestica]
MTTTMVVATTTTLGEPITHSEQATMQQQAQACATRQPTHIQAHGVAQAAEAHAIEAQAAAAIGAAHHSWAYGYCAPKLNPRLVSLSHVEESLAPMCFSGPARTHGPTYACDPYLSKTSSTVLALDFWTDD